MEKKTKGSWLIHHTNKLQKVDSQRGYEKTYMAGKCGILLSALASDEQVIISNDRAKALAEAANINTVFELPYLLTKLEERDIIDRGGDQIAVLGVSTAKTLSHTVDIFESADPSKKEIAAIEIAESASNAPIDAEKEKERIADLFTLGSKEATSVINESEMFGFVDVENISPSEKLLFNGNLFRKNNAEKIKKILDTLTLVEQKRLSEVTDLLHKKACVETTEVEKILDTPLYKKLTSVGFFDINVVSNKNESIGFITLPSAFNKYSLSTVDDAFDLAKAFVSSITYGMTKSSYARGKISMVEALISKLVRGEPVGPVSAIAQDYKILELKGVVKVSHGSKNGRSGPMLTLLKKEVGELALQVIKSGDVSEHSLDALPGAAVTLYRAPEYNRSIQRRTLSSENPDATHDILRVLRTGGF